jgi:hypothetical protein
LGGQVPVFISPRNRVAQLYHRALGRFSTLKMVITFFRKVDSPYGTISQKRAMILTTVARTRNPALKKIAAKEKNRFPRKEKIR